MKTKIIAVLAMLLSACAHTPTLEEETVVVQSAEEKFCENTAEQLRLSAREIDSRSEFDISVIMTSCVLLGEDIGVASYIVRASNSGDTLFDMGLTSVISMANGVAAPIKESPVFAINYVTGEFVWMVPDPVEPANKGIEL